MKTLKEKIAPNGEHTLAIVLAKDEKVRSFREDCFYKLGGQLDDVVAGSVIIDADSVTWCSVEQAWVSVS